MVENRLRWFEHVERGVIDVVVSDRRELDQKR